MTIYKAYYSDGTIWEGKSSYDSAPHINDESKVLHREGGPAWSSHSEKLYYKNGMLHRLDGPASDIYYCGEIERLFYIEGYELSAEEFVSVLFPVKKEDIIPYLLSDNRGIRMFAEYRLKQFEEAGL